MGKFPINFQFLNFQIGKSVNKWKMTDGKWKFQSAYTLIEILVAVTILGIIFGAGYISFRDFSRRQALAAAARSVAGDLRLTQEFALSGKKPTGCTDLILSGYRFKISSGSYDIVAVCGTSATEYGVKAGVSLPTGITMSGSPQSSIFFKILGQGNNIPAGTSEIITLTQTVTNKTQTVTVTSGGEIK